MTEAELVDRTNTLALASGRFLHELKRGGFFRVGDGKKSDLSIFLTYINNTVEKIRKIAPNVWQRLTFISMQSGGLSAEYLIDEALAKAGYPHRCWRFIDLCYRRESFFSGDDEVNYERLKNVGMHFAQGRQDVQFFITGKTYFKKTKNGVRVAELDRKRGLIILLSSAPWSSKSTQMFWSQRVATSPGNFIQLDGRLTTDEEATCICVLGCKAIFRKIMLDKAEKDFEQFGEHTSDYAIKISLKANGTLHFDYPTANKDFAVVVKILETALGENQENFNNSKKIGDLRKIIDEEIEKLNNSFVGGEGFRYFFKSQSIKEFNTDFERIAFFMRPDLSISLLDHADGH